VEVVIVAVGIQDLLHNKEKLGGSQKVITSSSSSVVVVVVVVVVVTEVVVIVVIKGVNGLMCRRPLSWKLRLWATSWPSRIHYDKG